jgi:condensin complex subunit 1
MHSSFGSQYCQFTNSKQEKQARQLSNKLAARLPRAENERQWRDVEYTLGFLQHKDEEIQKMLSEGFKVVQTSA